ncbi:hypothetical protein QBC34DRAFT_440621 [Podospora aff. communis PSN243]|uniref:MSP domain-containing protein n=1 Tax=Podospora aff. communis PSN243 TaxID=3040156 RepID=A0AAV9GH24_9PEZI|nr:hypothetical protein QBC34DRAFT_440621 [Podospora aff. communis PSN243]
MWLHPKVRVYGPLSRLTLVARPAASHIRRLPSARTRLRRQQRRTRPFPVPNHLPSLSPAHSHPEAQEHQTYHHHRRSQTTGQHFTVTIKPPAHTSPTKPLTHTMSNHPPTPLPPTMTTTPPTPTTTTTTSFPYPPTIFPDHPTPTPTTPQTRYQRGILLPRRVLFLSLSLTTPLPYAAEGTHFCIPHSCTPTTRHLSVTLNEPESILTPNDRAQYAILLPKRPDLGLHPTTALLVEVEGRDPREEEEVFHVKRLRTVGVARCSVDRGGCKIAEARRERGRRGAGNREKETMYYEARRTMLCYIN